MVKGDERLEGRLRARVLVVDDRIENVRAVAPTLEELGAEVVTATSGRAALRELLDADFALVLLDVLMPEIDGLTVARYMRERERTRDVPVLFMTAADVDEALLARAYDVEAADVLAKPVSAAALRAKCATLVRLHRQAALLRRQAELLRLRHEQEIARRHAERERERLRALLQQMPAAIALLRGDDLVYELSNEVNQRLLGGRAVVGKRVDQALPEPEYRPFVELVRHVHRSGERFVGRELRALVHDGPEGTSRWAYLNGGYEPVRDLDGRIDGVFAFAYDVTEQVESRKRVEESEARFRLTSDALPVLIALVDTEQRYRLVNRTFEEWFRVSRDEVVGRSVREVVGDAAYAEIAPHIERALRGEPVTYESMLPYTAGARWVRVTYVPHVVDEEVRAIVALVVDVTDQRARERERADLLAAEREARAAAEHAVRHRDDFLSVASHELKTPLTALELELEALERSARRAGDEDAAFSARVAKVRRQSRRLTQLVDVLLDVSRIVGGRLELAVEECDLVEVAEDVAGRFLEQARTRGANVRVLSSGRVAGRWDRGRLDQVLTNLLSNALKYGGEGDVDVLVDAQTDRACVRVRDRGPGIPAEHRERIFRRFERASASPGGLGLGLWIVREIVVAHGGSVDIEPTDGGGTTFAVELPLRCVDERAVRSPS